MRHTKDKAHTRWAQSEMQLTGCTASNNFKSEALIVALYRVPVHAAARFTGCTLVSLRGGRFELVVSHA